MVSKSLSKSVLCLALLMGAYQPATSAYSTLGTAGFVLCGATTVACTIGSLYYRACYWAHKTRFADQELVLDLYQRVQDVGVKYQDFVIVYENAGSAEQKRSAVHKVAIDGLSAQQENGIYGEAQLALLTKDLDILKDLKKTFERLKYEWAPDKINEHVRKVVGVNRRALALTQVVIVLGEIDTLITVLELIYDQINHLRRFAE